jgi:hypothetical protein
MALRLAAEDQQIAAGDAVLDVEVMIASLRSQIAAGDAVLDVEVMIASLRSRSQFAKLGDSFILPANNR